MLQRARHPELMDDPVVDPAELARSLGDIRAVNRWLGGTRAMLGHLDRMVSRLPARPIRVLDVATGSADIPRAIAALARERRWEMEIVATDFHPQTVAIARERLRGVPHLRVEQADALELPYADGAFDFALCSNALHHFDGADAVRVVRELNRVAAWGFVVSDLCRSRPALLGAKLLAATVWRGSRMTRHDGPLSVRRAFTAAELRQLAEAAGLRGARIRTHPMFRLALVVDRTTGPAA